MRMQILAGQQVFAVRKPISPSPPSSVSSAAAKSGRLFTCDVIVTIAPNRSIAQHMTHQVVVFGMQTHYLCVYERTVIMMWITATCGAWCLHRCNCARSVHIIAVRMPRHACVCVCVCASMRASAIGVNGASKSGRVRVVAATIITGLRLADYATPMVAHRLSLRRQRMRRVQRSVAKCLR